VEGAGFSEVSVTEYKFVVSQVMPPLLKPDVINFCYLLTSLWGQDSSVSIVTPCGLDSSGIECRWGQDFPHPSRLALGPTQPPIEWVPVLFPRGKQLGCGIDHPPLSSAEVKERVELYLYHPSWPVLG